MNTKIIFGIIFLILILTFISYLIYCYKTKKGAQLQKVKQWLLYAVIEAEKKMGGGTGEIKLRYVYDKFLTIFPRMSLFVSFDLFKTLVDEALQKAKDLLQQNEKLKNYVKKDSENNQEEGL